VADSQFILALDSGSQSSRALIFDATGAVLAHAGHAHAPMRHPMPGAVEQDPHDIRRCLFAAVRDCLAAWGGDTATLAALSMTTQRETMMLLDPDGVPLADAVSWLDRRRATVKSEDHRGLRLAFRALGEQSLVPRLLFRSKARQWKERAPDLLAAARHVVPLEAWLHHELTGRVALSSGGLVGAMPVDAKARTFDSGKLMNRLLGWEPRWFCDVVEGGQAVGGLSDRAAQELGLPAGLPVIACGGDKQAETLGAGLRPGSRGRAGVSLGTASTICVPHDRPTASPIFHWLTLCGCEPDGWQLEYMVFRGMWTLRWFAEQFGRELLEEAKETGRPAEALLCDEAAQVPPGSDGVVTWPRWAPSLQDANEAGTVLGLREFHQRGHAVRSLLEGIAYDLRRGKDTLERATKTPITGLSVGGGGSRSDLLVQILADVLNLPVTRPASEELGARGAAICGAVGGGVHASFDAAVAAMVPEAPVVQPDPIAARRYDRIYSEVYLPGFDELKRLSRALSNTL